jgi:hypothetical protein
MFYSCTFLFSRKVPKEHTAIQKRFAPLGTSASGAALGNGLRDYFIVVRRASMKAAREAEVRESRQRFARRTLFFS